MIVIQWRFFYVSHKFIQIFTLTLGMGIAQANTVSVSPASKSVNLGEVFSISILGSGFTSALDAGGLNISFDSSVITPAPVAELPASVTNIAVYGSNWSTTTQPVLNGNKLDDAFFFADSAPSGDFNIVNLWFKAIGAGVSVIELEESALNPFAGGGSALAISIQNGEVKVVPLPAAVWLFVGGLVSLFGLSRRTL